MKAKHPYKSTTHEEYFVHKKVGPTKGEIDAAQRNAGFFASSGSLPQPFMLGKHAISHVTYFIRKENDGVFYMTETWCSLSDQFNKEEGRKHARAKYFRTPQHRQRMPGTYREFMEALFPEAKPVDGPLIHEGVEFPRVALP